MTLNALSGGRFVLGLGPSGPRVVEGWYGVPYGRPMTRTREYIDIVRQVAARRGPWPAQPEEVADGRQFIVHRLGLASQQRFELDGDVAAAEFGRLAVVDGPGRRPQVVQHMHDVQHQGEVREVLDTYLRHHQMAPRIGMEIASNETIKAAVTAGLGIGFLSLHAVAPELRNGLLHIVDFEDTPLMRTWNIVNQVSKVLSPAAEAFRYFVLEHAEGIMREQDPLTLVGRNAA